MCDYINILMLSARLIHRNIEIFTIGIRKVYFFV